MERTTPEGDALMLAMIKQRLADNAQQAAEFIGTRWGVNPTMQNLTRFQTGYDPETGDDLTKLPLLPNAESGSRLGEVGAWFGQRGNAPVKRVAVPHLGGMHAEMGTVSPGPVPAQQQGMDAATAYQTMLNSDDPEARKRAMVVYALKGGT